MTFTLDGHRSLPIEVQSLVTKSVLPTPRRAANGVDANRIAMLVAVLYRHGNVNLLANDLYISTIAGGQAREPDAIWRSSAHWRAPRNRRRSAAPHVRLAKFR